MAISSVTANVENIPRLLPTIQRRDGPQFDARQHLDRGMDVFRVPDYVKSYNIMDGEFE